MRRHSYLLSLILLGYVSLAPHISAQPASADPGLESKTIKEKIKADEENLFPCYARGCGLAFLCNPQWEIRMVDKDSMIITISSEPFVTLAISRIDSKIGLLGQLNRSFFTEKQIYTDNFQNEYTTFAGRDAVLLRAFSKEEPDMRYLGYFYIYQGTLNSVLFAVYPQERWEDYKFFIKRIADSFRRI